MSAVRVGIIGLGNVGGGTLRLLRNNASEIEGKLGFALEVSAVCSRSVLTNPSEAVSLHPQALRTPDWREVVESPDVDIVAELIGGTGSAKQIVETALAGGKPVVTANKELLAEQGPEIWQRVVGNGATLGMEAAVAGGIPVLSVLREGIAGDGIDALIGILNGTSNYILTEIERTGAAFDQVLMEAQDLGYAEADPSADIDGYDARSKLAILAAMAFGQQVSPGDIPLQGIRRIRTIDFAYAGRLGHTIRLLATARREPNGLRLAVRPALVERNTIMAGVTGSYNALWVHGPGRRHVLLRQRSGARSDRRGRGERSDGGRSRSAPGGRLGPARSALRAHQAVTPSPRFQRHGAAPVLSALSRSRPARNPRSAGIQAGRAGRRYRGSAAGTPL